MSDMSQVIIPKSDQISADDLIGGDMTIKITGVTVSPGQEQPVSMRFEGNSRVFRPCKSMARVMVAVWGADSSAYVGRKLQLYRDPTVKWGGMEVGGIRIRAMSHMPNDRPMTMALTATKGQRKPYTVQPIIEARQEQAARPPAPKADAGGASEAVALARAAAHKGTDHFRAWFNSDEGKDARATGEITPEVLADCKAIAQGADHLAPKIEADEVGKALAGAVPTDDEIRAQIEAEHAAAMAREA
ncbi:MAG: hypothetical protein ACLGIP_16765 [Alphaproteobacteria bacterium]